MKTGRGGGANLDKNRTPQANFKRLVNKNAINPKIGYLPWDSGKKS
jgi:hypothetical protein